MTARFRRRTPRLNPIPATDNRIGGAGTSDAAGADSLLPVRNVRALLLAGFLLVGYGCSYAPSYSLYQGPNIATRTGGTVTQVRGLDVWDSGTPPRRYRILGMMCSEGGRHSDIAFEVEQIAKAARAKRADAIVLMSAQTRVEGVNLYSGRFEQAPTVKALLIQYL